MNGVDIQRACDDGATPDDEDFHRWAQQAIEAAVGESRVESELSIRIVDEAESAELNSRYRGKAGPTNVLSFPADLPPELELPLLGDLVICAPVVRREAVEQDKAEIAHWAHMTVHGTLHLLGYDHIEDAEAEIMEALETAILEKLGFADPYHCEHHAGEHAAKQESSTGNTGGQHPNS